MNQTRRDEVAHDFTDLPHRDRQEIAESLADYLETRSHYDQCTLTVALVAAIVTGHPKSDELIPEGCIPSAEDTLIDALDAGEITLRTSGACYADACEVLADIDLIADLEQED